MTQMWQSSVEWGYRRRQPRQMRRRAPAGSWHFSSLSFCSSWSPLPRMAAMRSVCVVAPPTSPPKSRTRQRLRSPPPPPAPAPPPVPAVATSASADESTEIERVGVEKARIIRSRDAEAALLRRNLADRDARPEADVALRCECERLTAELADARQESARYRELVVDIEN